MTRWVKDPNNFNQKVKSMSGEAHYGKLLLLGEYSLMYGSHALTIPHRKNKVMLRFPDDNADAEMRQIAIQSNKQLQLFYNFLKNHEQEILNYLDLQAMQNDLKQGLFLESDIPSGYGLGSSGALIAALFSRFSNESFNRKDHFNKERLKELQKVFSFLESFFHGKSSGIDPLSSFVNLPILFSENSPEIVKHSDPFLSGNETFFLIDTKISRKTAPLVNIFREKCKDSSFMDMLHQQYIPQNDKCITSLLYRSQGLSEQLYGLSDLQLRHFREMIPEPFYQMWAKGLSSGQYTMKLCGAGGGGYLLCYTNAQDNLKDLLQYRHVEKISV